DLFEPSRRCLLIREIAGKGSIWTELHDGTGDLHLLGSLEGDGVPEERELRAADQLAPISLGPEESDASDPVRFARLFAPFGDCPRAAEIRTRAMQQEIMRGEDLFLLLWRLALDIELRETFLEKLRDAIVHVARP